MKNETQPQHTQGEHEEWRQDSADPRRIYNWKGVIAECNTIRGAKADEENAHRIVKAVNILSQIEKSLKFYKNSPINKTSNEMFGIDLLESFLKQAEQK